MRRCQAGANNCNGYPAILRSARFVHSDYCLKPPDLRLFLAARRTD